MSYVSNSMTSLNFILTSKFDVLQEVVGQLCPQRPSFAREEFKMQKRILYSSGQALSVDYLAFISFPPKSSTKYLKQKFLFFSFLFR